MKIIRSSLFMLMSILMILVSAPVMAAIDSTAEEVSLRTSCMVNGNLLDNCFTNWWTLNDWIRNTRSPNVGNPLKVNISPGEFTPNYGAGVDNLRINCNSSASYTGHTSYVGAGNNQTILSGKGGGNFSPLVVNSCTNMNFSHLQISNPNPSISGYGAIEWNGGGLSHWDSVKIIGNGRAWYETTCGATPGEHIWADSQIIGNIAFTVGVTYKATCDDSKFYASSISLNIPQPYSGYVGSGGAIVATGAGTIHVYGSNLVTNIGGGGTDSTNVAAASANNGGQIHIHGTGIDVISDNGQNVVALSASSGGMIHANSSAYFMQSTGEKIRISNNGGMIMAPYQWQSGTAPPDITSVNGSDQAVITNTADGHPHQLVYDDTCASKWYDTNLNACY